MYIESVVYFGIIHILFFVPGWFLLNIFRTKLNNTDQIAFSYVISILIFAFGTIIWLLFPNISIRFFQLSFLFITAILIYLSYKRQVFFFPKVNTLHLFFILYSCISLIYVSFPLDSTKYVPDPEFKADRDYSVFNVKILNLSHTVANDNYVPYRQAQFFVNRMDIRNDSFIREWGVNFFFRTPLMGAVTAFVFLLSNESLPKDYLWSISGSTFNKTYIHYQIMVQILNSLFIFPAYLVARKIFGKTVGKLTVLLLSISPFFLYNSFFSWPKSFAAFFILLSWYLLLHNKNYLLAGLLMALAYWSHDLGIIYFLATILFLFFRRVNIKDFTRFVISFSLLILPWILISRIAYKQGSLFFYYPFSLHGIPTDPNLAVREFFSTSVLAILMIKLKSLYFLLTPFHLMHRSEQTLIHRLWVDSIYSIPGSVGIPLLFFSYASIIFYFKRFYPTIISFILAPIITVVLLIGWPLENGGMASLHFAQSSIVLLTIFGIKLIVKIKNNVLVLVVLSIQMATILIVNTYNYETSLMYLFQDKLSYIKLLVLLMYILSVCYQFIRIYRREVTVKKI